MSSEQRQKQGHGATPGAGSAEHGSVQPQNQPPPKRVPDDKSSKVPSTTQRDGRTAHDKDGNAEHRRQHGGKPS